jgi:hypothetical protein
VWRSEVPTKPGIPVVADARVEPEAVPDPADLPSVRERDRILLRWREERVADLARRPATSPYPPVEAHRAYAPAESRRETRRLRVQPRSR